MQYQGPQSFKDEVGRLATKFVTAFSSRTTDPHIIIGDVDRVTPVELELRVTGDEALNREIDQRYKEWQSGKQEHQFQQLLAACDANIDLRFNGNPGAYFLDIDIVALHPRIVARFQRAIGLAQDQDYMMGLRGPALHEVLEDFCFPTHLTHEMFHWELGNTKYTSNLKTYYKQLFIAAQLDFDRKRDGPYSLMPWSGVPQDAAAVFNQHKNKADSLKLREFEDIAAYIFAYSVMPPPSVVQRALRVQGPEQVVTAVASQYERLGPKGFLDYAKRVINESFEQNRSAFEIASR